MNYRNRQLLDLSKGQPCMLEIPGVCNHDPATTVAAHSNQMRHGKGASIKAGDQFHCWSCSACHAWLDAGPAHREDKEAAFAYAFERTLTYLWSSGLIQVTGAKFPRQVKAAASKVMPRRFT